MKTYTLKCSMATYPCLDREFALKTAADLIAMDATNYVIIWENKTQKTLCEMFSNKVRVEWK